MDKFYSYFSDRDSNSIISKELIEINNTLKNINKEVCLDSKIDVPTLVVIGSQSSGKSTLLNRLLNYEVIPMGSKMETRTPINIELINHTSNYIEFGYYKNLNWIVTLKIDLTNATKVENIKQISDEIKIQTRKNAGEEMGISDTEINIKFYSSDIPNLNFIDLPGLTMIACTDRGQPKDIKEQIRNLLIKYISNPNNLILCVMPAREDLETDIALELVKEYDSDFNRTVGILTKVDLMNTNNNVSNYLLGNISRDLKLKYGYYAVKNGSNEDDYFNTHEVYSKLKNLDRTGIRNLGFNLSEIFIAKIRENIPDILVKIKELIVENNKKLNDLGDQLPTSLEAKNLILTKHITNISNNFLENLENRYSRYNTGRKLKEIFIEFRNSIDSINPFEKAIDKLLVEIIKNSDGNHMSMPLPTIEILEGCLLSPKLNCYMEFEPAALRCLDNVKSELNMLLLEILKEEKIEKYNMLYGQINDDISDGLFLEKINSAKKHIVEILKMEQSYIWTDNTKFLELLKTIPTTFNSNEIDISILKKIAGEYFNSIKEVVKHNIPKVIMYYLIRTIEKDINLFLLNKLHGNNYIQYLVDDKNLLEQRNKLTSIKIVLDKSKNTLENI